MIKINEIYKTNKCGKIIIKEIIDKNHFKIKFINTGYEKIAYRTSIKNGSIKDPYFPSVRGVGYIGYGKYKTHKNSKPYKSYKLWCDILYRCFSKKWKEKYPTYENVKLCEEWLNYQNFANRFESNYKEGYHLDKDLLSDPVNKIYSSETCIFIPQRLNNFLTNKKSNNSTGFIGVSFCKTHKKYLVYISDFDSGENKKVGNILIYLMQMMLILKREKKNV